MGLGPTGGRTLECAPGMVRPLRTDRRSTGRAESLSVIEGGSVGSTRTWSVFLVALAAIAFEVLLTRYFAIASWAEYGYWVISIAMVGYAFSGVLLALFRDAAIRHGERLLLPIAILLMLACAGGFYFATVNPFNPQQLQNPLLWKTQLLNIGGYYLALFPFFFLSGLFLSLCFVMNQKDIARLYAFDLVGAGLGAAVILALMFFVHPFYLVVAIPVLMGLAALLNIPSEGFARLTGYAATAVVLLVSLLWVTVFNRAAFCEFKAIFPVLHVEGNTVLDDVRSPRGYYLVLDNFTERRDLPMTNNSGLMGLADPPPAPGLYCDGNRMTSLALKPLDDLSYVDGALAAFPYKQRRTPSVLLVGSSGGFRPLEARRLGCGHVVTLESDPVVVKLLRKAGMGGDVRRESPQAFLARTQERFDIIDVADDYFDSGHANKYAFTRESVQRFYHALSDRGVLSLPVLIREWTVYAAKTAETVRDALVGLGIENPGAHVMAYRAEWTARILVSRAPFTQDDIEGLKAFCSTMSFDTSYFPGIDPATVEVWNQLPTISFEDETVAAAGTETSDPLATEMATIFEGDHVQYLRTNFFDVGPTTDDKPFPHHIFRPSRIGALLKRLDLIPQENVGFLVNMAVLAQAMVFGLVVLFLPMLGLGGRRLGKVQGMRAALYFACLGLGFLAIEITLIEKFSYLLNDSVSAFAVVLSGMLVFSGLGSYLAGKSPWAPRKAMGAATLVVLVSVLGFALLLDRAIVFMLDWPFALKCLAILALIAPASMALGAPFPLGIGALHGRLAAFLPMAWAINGAFSVISSPLANIMAVSFGYTWVFVVSVLLYPLAWLTFPHAAQEPSGSG